MALNPSRRSELDWTAQVFRPLIISGMMTCLAAAWVIAAEYILEAWNGAYLTVLTGVLTVETLFAERLARRRLDSGSRFWIRVVELVLVLALLKPAAYLSRSQMGVLAAEAVRWLRDPLLFFDFEYMMGAMLVLALWGVALDIGAALAELEDPYSLPSDRESGLAWLQIRFTTGAVLLLMALVTVQIDFVGAALRPVIPGPLAILPLVYVVLGLLLFGQARAALLESRWVREAVPVALRVERRWVLWGVGFVAVVAVLALIFPAGNTALGLYMLAWMSFLFVWIGQLLLFLLFLVFWLLLWPFRMLIGRQEAAPPPPEFIPPAMPAEALAENAGPAWVLQLRLAVFWLVLLGVLILAAGYYWKDRRGLGLGELWRRLWAWLRGTRRLLPVFPWGPRPRDGSAPVAGAGTGWWRRWQADGARARVRRLYLLLAERAARAGHARKPGQTPYEYETGLQPEVIGEEESLAALTDAFVAARYGRREFRDEEVGALHRLLDRLRRQFTTRGR